TRAPCEQEFVKLSRQRHAHFPAPSARPGLRFTTRLRLAALDRARPRDARRIRRKRWPGQSTLPLAFGEQRSWTRKIATAGRIMNVLFASVPSLNFLGSVA